MAKLPESLIRRLCLGGILLCLVLYLLLDRISDYFVYTDMEHEDAYFVQHTGCHIAALDMAHPPIHRIMQPPKSPKCKFETFLNIKYEPNGNAYFVIETPNLDALANHGISNFTLLSCIYHEVQRINDTHNKIIGAGEKFRLERGLKWPVKAGIEILRVECYYDSSMSVMRDVHFILPQSESQPQPQQQPLPPSPQPSPIPVLPLPLIKEPPRLSVMIIGINSVSHLNYRYQLRQTAAFIRTKLPHVEFWGYNKVGKNLYANLLPLLSGLSAQQIKFGCLKNHSNFDQCNFIWHQYHDAGYRTAVGEDSDIQSLFNFEKPGFGRPPTDYYLRPTLVEMRNFSAYRSDASTVLCSGERTFADVLWEFIGQLRPSRQQNLCFSYFWWMQNKQQSCNHANIEDKNLARLLSEMLNDGTLNHTFVLLMSDYEINIPSYRQTYQGMLEDTQPLLIAIYPQWIQWMYPLAIENLRYNAHSLTTSYDLHATLNDLLDLQQLRTEKLRERASQLQRATHEGRMPRGISLFLPIPDQRTCNNANIPMPYCLCQYLTDMPPHDIKAQRAGRYVVRNLNEKLERFPACSRLILRKIFNAHISTYGSHLAYLTLPHYEVRVQFLTQPGQGIFEASVRFSGYRMSLTSDITRTNAYRNDSSCIANRKMQKYCYCRK